MALLSPEGHYLKIEDVNLQGQITFRIYKDKDQRTKGPGEFEITKQEVCFVEAPADLPLNHFSDLNITLKQALISSGYILMRSLPEFEGYTDI